MGTIKTLREKMYYVKAHFRKCELAREDIFKEEFINFIISKFMCERRKALELIKACVVEFNYTEGVLEGKAAFLFNFEESNANKEQSE